MHGPARRAHRGGIAGGQDARRRNAGTGRRLHQCVRGGIAGKALAEKELSCVTTILCSALWQEGAAAHTCDRSMAAGSQSRAGLSAGEKLHIPAGEALPGRTANAMLVCRLDSVAWLLNLRAGFDVGVQPVLRSLTCLVGAERGASVH